MSGNSRTPAGAIGGLKGSDHENQRLKQTERPFGLFSLLRYIIETVNESDLTTYLCWDCLFTQCEISVLTSDVFHRISFLSVQCT